MITIDTLRADHMSLYGYFKPTTPFLASMQGGSVRFDRAYSTSSWTLPAAVSLLTGLEPAVHSVKRGRVDANRKVVHQDIIPTTLPVLPDALQDAGYVTVGVTANAHLDAPFGFSRGFDHYSCIGFAEAKQLDLAVRRAVASAPRDGRPRFVWVHYLDPHWPYLDHDDAPSAIRSEIPGLQPHLFPQLARLSTRNEFLEADIGKSNDVLRHTLALYDGEIHYVDRHVEQLFQLLEISHDDLVIITADHGEEFFEHGDVGHARTLFEEAIRVPLLMRFPRNRFAGQSVREPVSLVDVAPTVLDYLGLGALPGASGQSLLPILRGESYPARPIRASLSINADLEAIVLDGWKYIHDTERPDRGWLFDLSTDRGERRNLLHADPQTADRMRRLLTETIEAATRRSMETVTIELDEEHADRLRSLGYLR